MRRLDFSRPLVGLLLVTSLLLGGGPGLGCAPDQETGDADTTEIRPPVPSSDPAPTVADTSVEGDVPYVATPNETVRGMLELADVSDDDVVYDLGSGDGRIPIAAAQRYGARGVGIEIKPSLVDQARKNAERSGVGDRVAFRQQDLFKADFSEATVVTMYLFPEVNLRLRPMLFEQLEPGTHVVSHSFDMNGWAPDSTAKVNGDVLYLWTIPEEVPAHLQEK